jgi:hypothetical protein
VLRFDGTVSEIQGDPAGHNLPFSLNVGEPITGEYVFASQQDLLDLFLHSWQGKQGQLALTIDGTAIQWPTNFGLLNSGGLVDINGPPSAPNSSLFLGYIPQTDVFPGTGASLWLVGADGTISTNEDILNVNAWNELNSLRRIEMQFGYPNPVTVRATIGNFIAVPEPLTTATLTILASLALLQFRCRKLTRSS